MSKSANTPRSFWLTLLTFTIIVNLTMMRSTYLHLLDIKADLMRSAWSGMLVLCFVIVAICIWLMFRSSKGGFERLDQIHFDSAIWRVVGVIVFLAILYLIPYTKFKFEIGQECQKSGLRSHPFTTYFITGCAGG